MVFYPSRNKPLLALLGIVATLASCKSDPAGPVSTNHFADSSTYALLKSQIFQVSCVQCHNNNEAAFNGNLSLEADTAYASLVNVMAFNTVAAQDSFLRVMPSHPESSFLIKKLSALLEPGMGDPMPPTGYHPIGSGKLNFIRAWIAAGAPRVGAVADPNLLLDSTGDLQAPITPLPVPPAGTGFQLHMQPYTIPAGSEREIFIYKNNPNSTVQFIKSMDIRMREGSHHFILWAVDGPSQGLVDGQLRDRTDDEMARPRDFVNGAQTVELNYTFPPGVALALPPNKGFDLNSHYVNPTTQAMHGEAYINLYTTPQSDVQHVATPFLIPDEGFYIPAHSTYTRKFDWDPVDQVTHLFMLTSHAHRHMTSFKVWINEPVGPPIYENYDWHEPMVVNTDIVLQPGDHLYSETTWQNDEDRPLQWGFTSEDEMNVLLGYYWQ